MPGHALAVDTGGTFTDVVLRDAGGRTWVDKTLTTPSDLLEGVFRGVDAVLSRAGVRPRDVDDVVVHATTLVTNAIIERRGPPTALVVTRGFRDVLAIRDEHRYDMYDPQIEFPAPLVPPARTFTVDERVLADGRVRRAVDPAEVAAVADELGRQGIRTVAVCLLNSFRNPVNELAVREALLRTAPGLFVSLSSEVAPQIREYPRASTTVLNAYAEPLTRPYLRRLVERLAAAGFPHEPLVMLSHGGVIGPAVAGRFPVRMIESGPAAGALVAAHQAEVLRRPTLLSFDMGGTTAKACLIVEGAPLVAATFEVDRRYRFKPGSGFPVVVPAIDLIEIGAGGGSIAWVDALGLLKVGPHSAGSEPGPVCYARGGTEPTVTDADLVLGLLDPDGFLGGRMRLDREAAVRALGRLGERLGVDAAGAALGVFDVVGEAMAAAARAHAIERGIDLRGVPLLAFGGAGPVHACHVAERLDSASIVFPPLASVLSAFGTLVTPLRLDLARGSLVRLGALDWAAAAGELDALVDAGRRALAQAGLPADRVRLAFGADCRYLGQQTELTVWLDTDPRATRDTATLRRRFETIYETLYGVRLDDVEVELVGWRVSASGPPVERHAASALPAVAGRPGSRRAVRLGPRAVDAAVHARAALAAGQVVAGPAVIEEPDTTIVLLPGWRATVDPTGSIVATREA